jgi:hypothetical protein
MSQPETDVIAQAQEYIRNQQLPKAQRLLVEHIKKNPNSEQAWYLLSTAVDDPGKQIECLQRVLRINPANKEAQARLMSVMAPQAAPPAAPRAAAATSVVALAAASQLSAGEPSPISAPAQPAAPSSEPRPAEPAPVEAAKPVEPEPSTVDTELSSLRSKAKYVKPRKPRKRWPRIVILLLLILLAASVGAYLLMNNPSQAAISPAGGTPAAAVVPTDTPTPTWTPTMTPTPSITPTRYPPTWTPTRPPTVPPTRTPTPLPTLNPAVQAGLQSMLDQVTTVRGLDATADIPTALLPRELLEPALKSILDLQQRQPELVNQARGLAALGLIRPGFDLARYTINRFADNAGGFYVPWQYVIEVTGSEFGGVASIVYAHQAAHALLDQNYGSALEGLYPACTRGADQCQALQALIEGDAALTTERWLQGKDGAALAKDALPQYQALPAAVDDPSAPPFIARDVAFRSEYGRKFVEALYQRGGWAAVDKAYENLPASTEQILHPEKYSAGEKPVEVAATPLSGVFGGDWQLAADEALGEWRTYQLLANGVDEAARLSAETAQKAAAGWGGDRYRVYYDPRNDQAALAAEWTWDTPQDATEFQQAMSAYLDLRFQGARSQTPGQTCWSANRQTTCLYASNNGTLWVLAPESQLIDQVRQAYPGFK